MPLSQRQVAGCCGIGKTTVVDCVARAQRSGLDWSTAAALSDEELERRLYPPAEKVPTAERPAVDWAAVHSVLDRLVHNAYELKLKGESRRKTKTPVSPPSEEPS